MRRRNCSWPFSGRLFDSCTTSDVNEACMIERLSLFIVIKEVLFNVNSTSQDLQIHMRICDVMFYDNVNTGMLAFLALCVIILTLYTVLYSCLSTVWFIEFFIVFIFFNDWPIKDILNQTLLRNEVSWEKQTHEHYRKLWL